MRRSVGLPQFEDRFRSSKWAAEQKQPVKWRIERPTSSAFRVHVDLTSATPLIINYHQPYLCRFLPIGCHLRAFVGETSVQQVFFGQQSPEPLLIEPLAARSMWQGFGYHNHAEACWQIPASIPRECSGRIAMTIHKL